MLAKFIMSGTKNSHTIDPANPHKKVQKSKLHFLLNFKIETLNCEVVSFFQAGQVPFLKFSEN